LPALIASARSGLPAATLSQDASRPRNPGTGTSLPATAPPEGNSLTAVAPMRCRYSVSRKGSPPGVALSHDAVRGPENATRILRQVALMRGDTSLPPAGTQVRSNSALPRLSTFSGG